MPEYATEDDLENQKRECELCLGTYLKLSNYNTGDETLEICDQCIKDLEKDLK